MSWQRIKSLDSLAQPFVKFVDKCYPDAFLFVIILTFITFFLSLGFTDSNSLEIINSWGNGLPKLFTFTAQICVIMITAHALAHTDPIERFLNRVGSLPNSQVHAYAIVAFVSGIASLFAWSFGLIVGGLIAKFVAIGCQKKSIKVHYPLIVASAYSGYVIWHMGYSSSAALFVASENHSLIDKIGILPVTETIFSSFNIFMALVTLLTITIIAPLMRPKDSKTIIEVDAKKLFKKEEKGIKRISSVAEIIENNRKISFLFGFVILFFILNTFYEKGFFLDLNLVSWTFLCVGLMLSNSSIHYVRLINNAAPTVGPIILQYPFYAGIMGIMADTGLINILANKIVLLSSADTLPFFSFLSGGLVNMFIPSGGGQWAVQGPVMIEAAEILGVNPSYVVLGVAYGDQWTNMIQPFWTIPLLAIAGLHMRQIMGYTFVIFIFTGFIFGGSLLFLGSYG
ncbi:MAG: short-chain fatty acid transporter [Alphaproteobacteria bacterium]